MTVSLSVKNVPEELAEALRRRARRNHRSLQGELLTILEQAVRPAALTPEGLLRQARDSGLSTGDEATADIRELRDGR